MVMGHGAFLCRTMIGPAVVGAAVAVPVEAEAQAEEVMATANAAVGTHPRLAPYGRPTVVVPECQRMATAPLIQNYSRMNNAELYAEAYPDRSTYGELPRRHYSNNKV